MPHDGLAARLSLDGSPDGGIRIVEQPVRLSVRANPSFVPPFPLKILQALVEADAVSTMPLVLAIHRQLTMAHRKETPLNAAIWNAAGSQSAKKREAILRKLKSLPHIIEIHPRRTSTAHYKVRKGCLWGGKS